MTSVFFTHTGNALQTPPKKFAILIDPDCMQIKQLGRIIHLAKKADVDYFFVGGSLIMQDRLDLCIDEIKTYSDIPVVLFPGNVTQLHSRADAVLFLSLISGRNPDLLIGQHVVAAPKMKEMNLEVIPTGYMLVDGGRTSSVSYMSNTTPIPRDKANIAASTALAGAYLGLQTIYMDAGSGALEPVPAEMIQRVRQEVSLPIIVGGGICDPEMMYHQAKAGADLIVVGNAIEKDPELIMEMSHALQAVNTV